jgi:hypothetical protein
VETHKERAGAQLRAGREDGFGAKFVSGRCDLGFQNFGSGGQQAFQSSGFCETPEVLLGLIRWVRLRLRAALWRQWKTPRRRRAALLELGVRPRMAPTPLAEGLVPGISRAPKPCLLGFPMPSNRLVFPH